MNTAQAARRDALLRRLTVPALIESARELESRGATLTGSERLTLAWISDELLARAGGFTPATDAAFDALLDAGSSYLDALLATFPTLNS